MREYAAALEGVQAQASNVGAGRTKPGSIDSLVVSYIRSVDFAALRPTTKAVRLRIIEREIRIPHGDKPLKKSRARAHKEHHRREGGDA